MKKRISKILACVCALTLVVGSLALFTDEASIDGSANAGNLSITLEGNDSITNDLLAGGDVDIKDAATLNNWNPGDQAAFDYVITNTGNKAVRYQETITLTVKGDMETTKLEDCMLQITGTGDDNATWAATADGYTITYVVEEGVLSGVSNGTAAVEVVEGKPTSVTPSYTLVFDADALNEYQDAEISIKVDVKAVQFANTDSVSEYVAEA